MSDPRINPFEWVRAQVGWWIRRLRQGHPLHRWYARMFWKDS